jgi:hypothetical protein
MPGGQGRVEMVPDSRQHNPERTTLRVCLLRGLHEGPGHMRVRCAHGERDGCTVSASPWAGRLNFVLCMSNSKRKKRCETLTAQSTAVHTTLK